MYAAFRKKAVPKSTVEETAHNAVVMTIAFSPKSGVSTHLSPCNAKVGHNFECKRHLCLPFGDYAQVHEHEEPCNGTEERTSRAISLGLFDNAQGGHKFMSLSTGYSIK